MTTINSSQNDAPQKTTPLKTLLIAILAGIGASACCVAPLILLSLGLGGAWVGNLTAMEPYSGYFSALTLIMLALAFRQLYLLPAKCEQGAVCANPNVLKNQQIIFWLVTVILLLMISFPYYADLIL